jgi:hypothetical protein
MTEYATIEQPLKLTLQQLQEVLAQLTHEQYSARLEVLSHSSIGQHARHIIEFFQALITGYDNGIVNYDNRQRNHILEHDNNAAISELARVEMQIVKKDKPMQLAGTYSKDTTQEITVHTTWHRELVYNLEHLIHHMAMIRIGIRQSTALRIPQDFGVASATLRFKTSIL